MKDIANFLFEMNALKYMRRMGWSKEGVKNAESVADHTFRNTVIGYILAKMENADVDKVMKMCLFHDIPEIRIGDMDRVMKSYIEKKAAEKKSFEDQLKNLPEDMQKELTPLIEEFNEKETKESIIANDADILEMILQAKEYADNGHEGCRMWIERGMKRLNTESAKKIAGDAQKMYSSDWHNRKEFD